MHGTYTCTVKVPIVSDLVTLAFSRDIVVLLTHSYKILFERQFEHNLLACATSVRVWGLCATARCGSTSNFETHTPFSGVGLRFLKILKPADAVVVVSQSVLLVAWCGSF